MMNHKNVMRALITAMLSFAVIKAEFNYATNLNIAQSIVEQNPDLHKALEFYEKAYNQIVHWKCNQGGMKSEHLCKKMQQICKPLLQQIIAKVKTDDKNQILTMHALLLEKLKK